MYKKIYRNMCLLVMSTLVISAVLILCSCYTYFDNSFKKEVENEARIAASFLNRYSTGKDTLSGLSQIDKRITIISPDGNVIYDTEKNTLSNHYGRQEVQDAIKTGTGTAQRYSKTAKSNMYYYALRLDNGQILRISAKSTMPSMFYSILIAVLFVTSLMYILCAIVATRLTDNIVNPIENIDPFNKTSIENAYTEIQPFLKRIAHQNEEITRQTEKVTEQKARLRAIMDNINEGLVITDTNYRLRSINIPAMNILDIVSEDVHHKKLTELTNNEKIHAVLKKAASGEKNNIMLESHERAYQIFYSPIYDDGNISGTVLLLFDVTERTNNEKIRREFTANVSHELKTPLTTIHGYSQIIDSGIAKPEDIQGFVKKIEKESSRLMALVDDIIALSHIDEADSDSSKEIFELSRVIYEVTDSLCKKAEEKGVTLTCTCDDSKVYANMAQTLEMIYNLTDNAIKYNKPEGSVDVSCSNGEVTVSDTGIGIPEKYTDRIFERFFRVDKSHSKKVNGTGLGLSIVKHLAKINNAEITVKSVLGQGSLFTVTFRKDGSIESNL